MKHISHTVNRRSFLGATAASMAVAAVGRAADADPAKAPRIVRPPSRKRILLSCKLTMIAKEVDGKKLSLTERLKLAADAGFDGVDFDEAGNFTPEQARAAVLET